MTRNRKCTLAAVAALAASAVVPSFVQAANRYWDGGTSNLGGGSEGVSGGGDGDWNTALTNWDPGSGNHVAWINANGDTAIFGGSVASPTVTLKAAITAGGLQFNISGYTLVTSSTNTLTVNGVVTAGASQSVTLSGGGTVFFAGSASNSLAGLITVASTGGTILELQKSGSAQAIVGPLTIGSANSTIAQVKYSGTSTNMMGTGLLTINGRSRLDFNGATDTIGNVVIDNTGMTTATATNINSIINSTNTGNLTIGTLSITPAAGILTTLNSGTSGTLTLGGSITFTAVTTGNARITGQTLALGGNRTFSVARGTATDFDLDIASAITGSGNTLTSGGAGIIQFSGSAANTYGGLTTQSAGTLLLAKTGAANAIADGGLTVGAANNTAAGVQYTGSSTDMMGTGTITLNGRGVLDFNGKTDTVGNVLVVSTGATTTNPTSIINTAGGANLTIGSLGITPVAGLTSIVNAGTGGAITLGGDVTFTAATTGRAQITGTTLELGGATRIFNIDLGTGSNQDLEVAAAIAGTGVGITKNGTGRLVLSGTNTYTGTTSINTGTLRVNGSLHASSAVSVASGGTLSGNGTIGGAVSILGGGTLRAGNGTPAGQKLAVGSLSTGDNATLLVDVLVDDATSSNSKVNLVENTASFATTGTLTLVLSLAYQNVADPSNKLAQSQSFVVLSNLSDSVTESAVNGIAINAVASLPLAYSYAWIDGDTGTVANDLQITITAVPEPSGMATLGLVVFGLLARRRRASEQFACTVLQIPLSH
jgi:fibronectin-binding autotransporter adhesin